MENVDVSKLDEEIEKANRLVLLLREAKSIISSLSGTVTYVTNNYNCKSDK